MKKLLALVVTVVTAVACCFGMTGCKKNDDSSASDAAVITVPKYEENVPTVAINSDFKVGFIFLHDEKSTYDLNFINAAKEACNYFGLKDDQVLTKKNIPETNDCYDAAEQLVSAGCKVIFADSFGHEDYIMKSAKQHTDVQYFHATGTSANVTTGSRVALSNVHNAFANIYEGRYLAGYVAGLKLADLITKGDSKVPKTGDIYIGYVGAFTYAEVISGYTSWYLGVKQGCIDGGKEADAARIKMKVTFTGSWYDPTAEMNGANKLIAEGCIMISQHADSMGAPSACEKAGVYNVFYNGSTVNDCPNTFLIASKIDWSHYMKMMIGYVASGRVDDMPKDYCATIQDGAVVVTDANAKLVTNEMISKMLAMRDKLAAGTVKVFDTSKFTVNGASLTTYQADCIDVKGTDGKSNFEKDTEAIVTKGGITYFSESTVRSAPYFDISAIDGVTCLDVNFG